MYWNSEFLDETPQETHRGLNTIDWSRASTYAKNKQIKRFQISPIDFMSEKEFTVIEFTKRVEKDRW